MVIEAEATFFKHELSVDMSNRVQIGKGCVGYNVIKSVINNKSS